MKILRIDLQTENREIYENEEDLRTSLIDLHYQDYETSYYGCGYSEKEIKQKMKEFKQITLNQLCCEFDWDYQIITNKKAKEYEDEDYVDYESEYQRFKDIPFFTEDTQNRKE